MSAHESALEHAIDLASKGWPVFPVGDNKKPLTAHGLKDATTDPEAIATWWGEHPDALVAVNPGMVGKTVGDVDLDTAKDGFAFARVNGVPTEALVQRTSLSGKGRHLWYDGLSKSLNNYLGSETNKSSLDRKSEGGYVVVPYDLPAVSEVTEPLPSAWALQGRQNATESPYEGSTADWMEYHSGKPVSDAVSRLVGPFLSGEPFSGHQAMLDVQWALVAYATEGHGGVPEALAKLHWAWVSSPHTSGDANDEWNVGLAYAIRKRGGDLPQPVEVDEDDDNPEDLLTVVSIADLFNRPTPKWWVEGLFQQSTLGILAGTGGLGKSLLMLDIAACIAGGKPWKGHQTVQGNVLYVVAEGADSFGKRIKAWQAVNGPMNGERMGFVESGVNLSDSDSIDRTIRTAVAYESDFIILDTLSQLSDVDDENASAQMSRVLKQARRIREARPGSTVIVVHHTNKSDKGNIRGSGAIRANVDTAVVMKADGENGFTLSTKVSDDGKQKDGEPIHWRGFKRVAKAGSAVIEVAETDRERAVILSVLEDAQWHGMGEFLSMMGLGDSGKESDAARVRLRTRLVGLASEERIHSTGSGRHMKYALAEVPVP